MEQTRENWTLIKQINDNRWIYKEWDMFFIRRWIWKVTDAMTWEVNYFPNQDIAEVFLNNIMPSVEERLKYDQEASE